MNTNISDTDHGFRPWKKKNLPILENKLIVILKAVHPQKVVYENAIHGLMSKVQS